jgi:alkanesulfonate monooxygenase SsuD/methylene tetrahydromethanopterin reductase-like flavin-dependent oxidoreductase (luciferase family)
MWTQDAPTFHGRHFHIENAYNNPRPTQKPHPPLMLGGSGSGLLKIAAVEADIINILPPIFNGKDFVNDPEMAIKFDKPELKRRIAMLHRYMKSAGRDPKEIEISGLMVVSMSRNAADPAMGAVASMLGFPEQAMARNSPVVLMGTPEQVKRELESRIAETGMTYLIVLPVSEESHELFAKEIMPAFAN